MDPKRATNNALRRAFGVEIVQSGTVALAQSARKAERAEDARKADKAKAARAGDTKAASKPAAGSSPYPADYDEEGQRIIADVRPWTMTSPEKLYALILAVRYVQKHRIAGDILECGVWRGGSMQAVAKTLLSLGATDRELYLFDTYEGMPPPTEEDLRQDGKPAADMLAATDKSNPIWAYATLEDVQTGMARVPYPAERVHFVKGLVEDTIPAQAPEKLSILRLDTDWYASTRHELEQLYDRLSPGGVLLIDDYGWWQGSKQAVDEFLEQTGARLLLLRMAEGRIAVKP